MTVIGDAALEARCRDLVDDLHLPVPFSVPGLVEAVATRVGRPVHLQPLPPEFGPEVSGMVASTDAGFLVRYPHEAASWWALVCLCHELGHILCGHVSGKTHRELSAAASTDGASPDLGAGQAPLAGTATGDLAGGRIEGWLPDLQEAVAAWGQLYRCDLHPAVEREAELTATLLVQRIEQAPSAASPEAAPGRNQEVLGRFAQVLGGRRARRR